MKAPIYLRVLHPEEQKWIEAGLRSSDALYSASKPDPAGVQSKTTSQRNCPNLGCATQTVRNAIHAFEQKSVACLKQESSRPKTVQAQFDQAKCQALRSLLHQSPRTFGKTASCRTLALTAEVCFERGLTENQVSLETIRLALKRLGVGWQRAKHWITSPDPSMPGKNNGVTP